MTLRSVRPMKRVGKRAFLPPDRPLPPGPCTWCGKYTLHPDRDHVLPRDLFPMDPVIRDAPANVVPACRKCNRKRADGKLRPDFTRLPKRSQDFALAWWRPARLTKQFTNVPEAA